MIEKDFMNRAKFSKMIEGEVRNKKLSWIDATVEVCGITNMEPEDVKKFISPVIREKIEAEAMNLNFLPKQNELVFEDDSLVWLHSRVFDGTVYVSSSNNDITSND